jgi:hypothetical protein
MASHRQILSRNFDSTQSHTEPQQAAPFRTTRTLQQLAKDEVSSFPMASAVALRDFCVDDLISSTDSGIRPPGAVTTQQHDGQRRIQPTQLELQLPRITELSPS